MLKWSNFAAIMIFDSLQNIFRRGSNKIPTSQQIAFYGGVNMKVMPFADVIFLNLCELLSDLCNDVTFARVSGDPAIFEAFVKLFNTKGQYIINMLKRDGVVIIGHTQAGEGQYAIHHFHVCKNTEYIINRSSDVISVTSMVDGMEVYAMRTPTYEMTNKSDKQICQPYLDFLDNVLSASNTVSSRLGSVMVMSPRTPSGSAAAVSLPDFQRKDIEKEISKNYGALADQSSCLLLNTDMNITTINMAGLDQRTTDKVKLAVTAIADRLKVPANQVSVIDANSSKSLANGTELREGDYNKYQSFERLLNQSFVQFAEDMGLSVTYSIYNKPERQNTQI